MWRMVSIAFGAIFIFLVTIGALLFLAGVMFDIARGELYVWTTIKGTDIAHWDTQPAKFIFHLVGKIAIGLAMLSCVPTMVRQLRAKISSTDR